MTVSTKGRYALRVMVDLAEHASGDFIPLRAVAERQNISQKYLEAIMSSLSKAGLVEGAHGKGGGYRLCRSPEEYSVREILEVTEGDLAPPVLRMMPFPAKRQIAVVLFPCGASFIKRLIISLIPTQSPIYCPAAITEAG